MPIVRADAKVAACEAILDYTFRSEILLLEALNTAGQGNPLFYRGEFHDTIPRNKVLAEYGDNVADFVVMGEWMSHISTKRDRFVNIGISWDTVKKTLLSNPALYARGVAFGLHRCILLNPGQTIISQEMMARTFEALIGAVQIDGGTEAAKKVIAHLGFFEDRIWGVRSA